MKWLIIAVLILAQQPSEVPKNKRNAEANGTKSAAHEESTDKNKSTSAQSPPISGQSPSETEGHVSGTTNASHTETKPQNTNEDLLIQRKLAWFTGALVFVGVLQTIVMYLTWRIYRC